MTANRNQLFAAAVYVAGGVLYYLSVQTWGLDFRATPFFYGVVLLLVSIFRRDTLATAIPVVVWGIAVLLTHDRGPIEEKREAALYVVSGGLTAATFVLLQRWVPPKRALQGMAVALIFSGLSFLFVIDATWVWATLLVASGLFELAASFWPGAAAFRKRAHSGIEV